MKRIFTLTTMIVRHFFGDARLFFIDTSGNRPDSSISGLKLEIQLNVDLQLTLYLHILILRAGLVALGPHWL